MTNVVSDSVKRLRAANTWLNEGDCCGQLDASGTCMAPACIFGEALKMTNEAADRIEQLEVALKPLCCTCDRAASDECSRAEVNCAFWNARAALEERT